MTTVNEEVGPDAGGTSTDTAAAQAASPSAKRGWRSTARDISGLVSRHKIFSIALGLAVVPRVVAMLGFLPAVLFRLDTYDYLWTATHLSPNVINPSGYSLFLWLLMPFHSLTLIVAIQHVVGLGVATMVYALARRFGLSAWGATLTAATVLFNPAQILAEQLVMADLLAMALMVASLTVVLWRSPVSLPRLAAAGLMMGISVIIRPTTLPLLLLVPAYLLLKGAGWRRAAGWRQAGASVLAGALPVLGYMGWFAAAHGSFNLTNSNGLFLWSRTMSFANCAVIKPPANLASLCPSAEPAGYLSAANPANRPQPTYYLWARGSWQWRDVHAGFVPDTAAFTEANNSKAQQFALDAILAQPVSYLTVVLHDTFEPFVHNSNLLFPTYEQPPTHALNPAVHRYAVAAVKAYTGSTSGVPANLGIRYGAHLRQPFAALMNDYQRVIVLPGPLLALIALVGLIGIILPRRRDSVALLLWVSAAVIIVLPSAEHEYAYRYMLPAIPLVCIAAAIALRKPGQEATVTALKPATATS